MLHIIPFTYVHEYCSLTHEAIMYYKHIILSILFYTDMLTEVLHATITV